jgi:hypothetical protein
VPQKREKAVANDIIISNPSAGIIRIRFKELALLPLSPASMPGIFMRWLTANNSLQQLQVPGIMAPDSKPHD